MPEDHETELAELIEEVRRIEVQSRRWVTELMAGAYSSVFRGTGIEFDEVREYADGDDPRMVDWNVTARMGWPYIKKYVDERELNIVFALDLSASMSGGFGIWSARQMAARICACLAISAEKNKDKVGLVAFSRDVDKYVPPKKGIAHVLRIIRDCLVLPGKEAGTDLKPAIEFISSVLTRRSVLFLISDFFSHGWEETVSLCSRRNDVVAVRLLPLELAPPEAGLMRLCDPETGNSQVVDWSHKPAREAYKKRIVQWQAHTEEALRRAGVDLMDVPVPREYDMEAVVKPIVEFFRMRTHRGARQ